jgi:serine/threonine protein kinase
MQYVEEKIVTVDGHTAIKRYLILEKVGEGAFSQCYKVQAQGTDQIYAMKIISKEKMKIL